MSDLKNSVNLPESIESILVVAGLVPVDTCGATLSKSVRPGEDLLPFLIRLWEASSEASPAIAAWLHAEQDRGGQLSVGFPDADWQAVTSRIGSRIAWWPSGIVRGNRVGIASSRLGRRLDLQPDWFSVLRAACGQIDPDHDRLLVVERTASAPFVARAADLFRLPRLEIQLPDREAMTILAWVGKIMKGSSQETDRPHPRCVLSPPWNGDELSTDRSRADSNSPHGSVHDVPLRDRALVAISDRLFVIYARQQGQIERLIDDRLADPSWSSIRLYIALGDRLVDRSLADRWMDAGAIGWIVPRLLEPDHEKASKADDGRLVPNVVPTTSVVPVPKNEAWPYLVHCTRRHDGPWPDQSPNDYLDTFILDRDDSDRSALASLVHIVQSRRLVASAVGLRGGSHAVSFSAVPLGELHRLRVFRSHRGRWDFEPYGIAIDRAWLEGQGARPVHYGDDAMWESLDPDQRAFFQVAQSATRGKHAAIDWTIEQEWRHLGDVDLARVPTNRAIVFVRSRAEAEQLATFSPWPVAVA